jgi:hypothetical protein
LSNSKSSIASEIASKITTIDSEYTPKQWIQVFYKANTLKELLLEISKKDEDDLPLKGLLLFKIFVTITLLNNKPTIDLFIDVVKRFYPRETALRELIESCSTNYNALRMKLRDILDNTTKWMDEFNIYSIISEYIYQEQHCKGDLNCRLMLMYRLLQCIAMGKVVDNVSQYSKYIDELYYVDETLASCMSRHTLPIEFEDIKL